MDQENADERVLVLRRRIQLGLTQQEAAVRMGVHYLTVKNWERGHTRIAAKHRAAVQQFLASEAG